MIILISCKEKTKQTENKVKIQTKKAILKSEIKPQKFYKININEKSVIGILPDSLEIEKMKVEMGETDFYTMTDDIMYYQSKLFNILDSLKIKYIHTDKKLIEINTPNKIVRFNADSTPIKWNYFYFNGKEIKEMELFDLLDLQYNKQPFKNEIEQKIFDFKNFKEFKLNDTIKIDIDGDSKTEQIYFQDKGCKQLIIEKENKTKLTFGCGDYKNIDFLDEIGWVDQWCVVYDTKVWEVLFKDNGDIDRDTIIKLERPSIYIGKKEAGGGIITYKNGKLYWIHQSD